MKKRPVASSGESRQLCNDASVGASFATKTPKHKAAQRSTSCGFVFLRLSGETLRNTLFWGLQPA